MDRFAKPFVRGLNWIRVLSRSGRLSHKHANVVLSGRFLHLLARENDRRRQKLTSDDAESCQFGTSIGNLFVYFCVANPVEVRTVRILNA